MKKVDLNATVFTVSVVAIVLTIADIGNHVRKNFKSDSATKSNLISFSSSNNDLSDMRDSLSQIASNIKSLSDKLAALEKSIKDSQINRLMAVSDKISTIENSIYNSQSASNGGKQNKKLSKEEDSIFDYSLMKNKNIPISSYSAEEADKLINSKTKDGLSTGESLESQVQKDLPNLMATEAKAIRLPKATSPLAEGQVKFYVPSDIAGSNKNDTLENGGSININSIIPDLTKEDPIVQVKMFSDYKSFKKFGENLKHHVQDDNDGAFDTKFFKMSDILGGPQGQKDDSQEGKSADNSMKNIDPPSLIQSQQNETIKEQFLNQVKGLQQKEKTDEVQDQPKKELKIKRIIRFDSPISPFIDETESNSATSGTKYCETMLAPEEAFRHGLCIFKHPNYKNKPSEDKRSKLSKSTEGKNLETSVQELNQNEESDVKLKQDEMAVKGVFDFLGFGRNSTAADKEAPKKEKSSPRDKDESSTNSDDSLPSHKHKKQEVEKKDQIGSAKSEEKDDFLKIIPAKDRIVEKEINEEDKKSETLTAGEAKMSFASKMDELFSSLRKEKESQENEPNENDNIQKPTKEQPLF